MKTRRKAAASRDSRSLKQLERECRAAVSIERKALLGRLTASKRHKLLTTGNPYSKKHAQKWKAGALAGVPDGQYLWAQVCLNTGRSKSGISWLKRAVDQGHALAETTLGDTLVSQGKTREGLKYLQSAIQKGDAWAMHLLAMRYATGMGLRRDTRLFLQYLKKAAEAGCTHATSTLALLSLQTRCGGCS